MLIVVNPSTKFSDAQQLVAAAKAQPGKVTYASPGLGTPHHVSMELFKVVTGTDLLHVPYKGSAGAVTDLISGQVQSMFLPITVAMPHVRDGRLKALGLGSGKRSASAPEIPTLAEQGISGAEVDVWYAMMAPSGTPKDIVNRMNQAVNETLNSAEVKSALEKQGIEIETTTPEQLAALLKKDWDRWGDVLRRARLTVK
ncbi:MAG: hypothetical protein JW395_3273 [Nitrospira sp.]|nr:hypothetical protein [Nitrospira sp.]